MSLDNLSREDIEKMSMLQLAKEVLIEEKKAIDFRDIYDQVTKAKGLTEQQKEDYLAQFYTDLNVDGRFMTIGNNLWGLKRWYPVEQIDEDVQNEPKKKKKAKKKKVEEEEDDILLDDEDLDLDEDEDDLEDDDFDLDDEDEDDDDDFDDIDEDDEDFDDFDDDEDEEDLDELDEDEEDDLEEEK